MAKKTPATSSARMKAAGKTPSLLWLDPDQRRTVEEAAAIDGRPMTQFLLHHGLTAAKKILAKSRQES